jgi:hypothetical protein
MRGKLSLLIAVIIAAITGPAFAQDRDSFSTGGDIFVGGNQMSVTTPVSNDIFAIGNRLNVNQTVGGDVHAAGFSISLPQPVTGDVYAIGNDVTISGSVGADVTAFASSIILTGSTSIGGNARLVGANVTIEKPINGATIVAAGNTHLDASINGDFSFSGGGLTFGSNAKILGNVTIYSDNDIEVPASVASSSRVRYERYERPHELDIGDRHNWWAFGWIAGAFFFIALLVLGFVWLALFPRRSAIAYETAMARPGKSILTGIGTLAAFIGIIPLLAITLIGFLLVPFAVVFLVLAGLIGYIAGSWYLAQRVLALFGYEEPTSTSRNLAIVLGIIGAAILGFVPFIGWLIQLGLVVFGLGGITLAAFGRWDSPQEIPTP